MLELMRFLKLLTQMAFLPRQSIGNISPQCLMQPLYS